MPQALPDIRKLEVVLFHKDLNLPSHWLVLQVPLKKKLLKKRTSKSNTFRINLQVSEDRAWFKSIPMERRISDCLSLYGHAVYFPVKGEVIPVDDKDNEPLTTAQRLVSGAHRQVQQIPGTGRWGAVKRGMRKIRHPLAR